MGAASVKTCVFYLSQLRTVRPGKGEAAMWPPGGSAAPGGRRRPVGRALEGSVGPASLAASLPLSLAQAFTGFTALVAARAPPFQAPSLLGSPSR